MTYRRNFHHRHVEGDITLPEVKKDFYDSVKKGLKGRQLTVVAGGFPCQGFSMAGNRIVDDPRNSLYKEMLENTKNYLMDYKGFDKI
jgi:DNA (cytosine-5)-methyltransferase 1